MLTVRVLKENIGLWTNRRVGAPDYFREVYAVVERWKACGLNGSHRARVLVGAEVSDGRGVEVGKSVEVEGGISHERGLRELLWRRRKVKPRLRVLDERCDVEQSEEQPPFQLAVS